MTSADEKLVKNLENQFQRLIQQLKDLEETRDEMSEDAFEMAKTDTSEQIKEFKEILDRMQNGNCSLESKFSIMKKAITEAITESFDTVEMIKMFGAQNASELEKQLLQLDEDYHLKKIEKDEFEEKKVILLKKILSDGNSISASDSLFLELKEIDENDSHLLEKLEDYSYHR